MRLFPLFLIAPLAGCMSVVPTTMAMLSATSPLDADPAAIEVVLVLPAGLQTVTGGATFGFESTRKDNGERLSSTHILAQRPVGPDAVEIPAGAHAEAFRLQAKDIEALRKAQTKLKRWRSETGKANAPGSISVGIAGCKTGLGPSPDSVGSIYVRTEKGGRLWPLVRNAALGELLGSAGMPALAPCDGPI